MAITQVGTIQGSGLKNGATVTLTFDVALQEGDVVYVLGGSNAYRTNNIGPQASYGYSQVYLDTSLGFGFGVWRKKMGASPATDVATIATGNTADSVAYQCIALRGVDPTTQEDVAVQNATGTSTNPDPPSIDPTTNDCCIVIGAGGNVSDASIGQPSGYTYLNNNAADTNPFTAAAGFRVITGGGPEDPPAFGTWSSSTWRAVSVAVRPQASANIDRNPGQANLTVDQTLVPTVTVAVLPISIEVPQASLVIDQSLTPTAIVRDPMFSPNTMTTDTWPEPYVSSASSVYPGGFEAYKAFNSLSVDKWASGSGSLPEWIQIDVGSHNLITSYSITATDPLAHYWVDWTLNGSDNGVDWTTIDTRSAQTWTINGEEKSFFIGAPKSYRYWRFIVTSSWSGTYAEISEIKLFGIAGLATSPPVSDLALDLTAPTVEVGVEGYNIAVPQADLIVDQTLVPILSIDQLPIDIEIPQSNVALDQTLVPTFSIDQLPIDIEAPVADLALDGTAPTVSEEMPGGITVPANDVALSAFAPAISATANQFITWYDPILLLHGDGSDGSQIITDSGSYGYTVIVNGTAQVDTAQSVFGGASINFPAASDTVAVNDELALGNGNFTIDFRYRKTASAVGTILTFR